jgi:hypothetical protein
VPRLLLSEDAPEGPFLEARETPGTLFRSSITRCYGFLMRAFP